MISHAEAGNMANANCQPNIPAHAIPSSDFDLVRATAPSPIIYLFKIRVCSRYAQMQIIRKQLV
jgi:hypothetical protein